MKAMDMNKAFSRMVMMFYWFGIVMLAVGM